MKISMLCFSKTGMQTGEVLRRGFLEQEKDREVSLEAKSRYVENSIEESHSAWTKRQFQEADAIIFIGACGIAVRSIAPCIVSKKSDPAVLVVDECGKFVISLLSGHLGGANALAASAARILGAIPVITTATDLHQRFAVDVFAEKNQCGIRSMKAAKEVSAAILAGEPVGFFSEFPVEGTFPQGLVRCERSGKRIEERNIERIGETFGDPADLFPVLPSGAWEQTEPADAGKSRPRVGITVSVCRDCSPFPVTVQLIPRILMLGMGCRRGKDAQGIALIAQKCLEEGDTGFCREALEGIASIDLKKEEPGLLALAENWNLPFQTFSAEELAAVEGTFTKSEFVNKITGVDNVCERSAVLASGGGVLIRRKTGAQGVTAALAQREWRIRFE